MNQNQKVFGIFSSSINPAEISLTFTSIAKGVGFILAGYAAIKGIPVAGLNDQLTQLAQLFTAVVTAGYTIYQSGQAAYGIFRKILAYFYPTPTPQG